MKKLFCVVLMIFCVAGTAFASKADAARCHGTIEFVDGFEDFRVFIEDSPPADLWVVRKDSIWNDGDIGEWCIVSSGGRWRVKIVHDRLLADFTILWCSEGYQGFH